MCHSMKLNLLNLLMLGCVVSLYLSKLLICIWKLETIQLRKWLWWKWHTQMIIMCSFRLRLVRSIVYNLPTFSTRAVSISSPQLHLCGGSINFKIQLLNCIRNGFYKIPPTKLWLFSEIPRSFECDSKVKIMLLRLIYGFARIPFISLKFISSTCTRTEVNHFEKLSDFRYDTITMYVKERWRIFRMIQTQQSPWWTRIK